MNPDIPIENPAPDKGVEIDTGNEPDEINLDPYREPDSDDQEKK